MPVLVGKAVDFVLYTRAVARSQALDAALEHGRFLEAFAQDVVHPLVGVGDVAGALLREARRVEVGEFAGFGVAALFLHFGVVEAAAVHAGWGAGFHAPGFKTQLPQLLGNAAAALLGRPSAAKILFPNVDKSVQKRAVGQHHRLAPELNTEGRCHAHHSVVFHHHAGHGLLPEIHVGDAFQG